VSGLVVMESDGRLVDAVVFTRVFQVKGRSSPPERERALHWGARSWMECC